MKFLSFLLLAAFSFFSLNAQEKKSKIYIKMEQDGKVLKDTVYEVDEDVNPDLVSKILDMTLGDYKGTHKIMAFGTEDGELHEFHGDHEMIVKEIHKKHNRDGEHEWVSDDESTENVFVTSEKGEDGKTNVIVKKVKVSVDDDKKWKDEKDIVYKLKDDGDKEEEVYKIKIDGDSPEWIEKDGHKILIVDSEGNEASKIKIIHEGESGYKYQTEDGETIIIHIDEKDGEKDVKVEVIKEKNEESPVEIEKEVKKKKKKDK